MGLFLFSDTINWCLKACEVTWKQQQATSSGGNNLQASSSLYCHLLAALVKCGIFQAEIPEENRR